MTWLSPKTNSLLRAAVLAGLLLEPCTAISSLQVDTTVGLAYGLINGTTPHVVQFLGIPYTEPPIGPLRWAPPVPKSPVGRIDATMYGPSCPQLSDPGPDVYTVDVQEFNINNRIDEDCLTLNVWAPLTPEKKGYTEGLPIVLWIFGGSFQFGGLDVEYQNPSQWVERTQSHIVIAMNYRLNIFGFPNAAGQNKNEHNLGLLDQRLALEWVRSNAAAFGGDPTRITLWGQSAGAASVDYYNFAYPKDPIVTGLIMNSATALHPTLLANDPTHLNFTFVAGKLGCGGLMPAAELECMRKKSWSDIENVYASTLNFSPVVDEVVVFSNYTARALAGNYTKLPAIIGSNSNEGASLIRYNTAGVDVATANYVTLSHFTCPAVQSAKDRYALNVPTFRYSYAGNFTNISPRPWEGAYHCAELPMFFGTSGIGRRGDSTRFELEVSHTMQDMYLAFITDGPEGLKKKGWNAYKPNGTVIEFGKGDKVVQNLPMVDFEKICVGIDPVAGSVPPM